MRAIALGAIALVAVAGATGVYLRVPLPRFGLYSSPSGPALSAGPSDDISYQFLNTQFGWALDSRRDVNGNGDFWIFHTDEGARHWQTQFRRKTSSRGTNQLMFFDPKQGFAVISSPFQLLRTVDGGVHWNQLRIPGRAVQSIQFINPFVGWLLDAEGSAIRNTLWVTRDGADTWQLAGYPPDDASGLAMRNARLGWMAGAGGPQPHVYLSSDGGESWHAVELPLSSGPGGDAHCVGGVALPPTNGVVASVRCGVYSSFDQGVTWVSVPTPPPDSTSWARITFATEFDWWTMTGGTLWSSADAGQTWKVVSSQHDGWDYIPYAIDRMQGWAVLVHLDDLASSSGLALTSDGGLHWTQVSAPRP